MPSVTKELAHITQYGFGKPKISDLVQGRHLEIRIRKWKFWHTRLLIKVLIVLLLQVEGAAYYDDFAIGGQPISTM